MPVKFTWAVMSFCPRSAQRIAVAAVGAVADQRAHVALGVVVLGFREAVVDEKGRAALQTLGHGAHKGLSLRVDLGQVVVLTQDVHRWTRIGRPIHPDERALLILAHATLVPHTAGARQQLHRHRVQHLVAHHHAGQGFGQSIHPAHHPGVARQRSALALAQAAREIHDGVLPRALPQQRQGIEQLARQRPGAGAKLPHLVGPGAPAGLAPPGAPASGQTGV